MQKILNLKHGTLKTMFFVFFLLCSTVMLAQNKVSGTVVDASGEPLIGVSVLEDGTTNGGITDFDGKFTLTVKSGAKLTFSYVGYTSQTLAAANGMKVTLQEDNTVLNEVVVVGYGTMRRKDVTSSITTVQAKDLNKGVFSDPASMLQGKVAGLTVTTSGDPNGTPSITLRGASSLREGAAMQPYYVIDGIPGVDISMVSPDDIESIDVLRDATATAIYGSKAANGVIIITTKTGGKTERTNVSYNGYVAFDKVSKTLDVASANDIRNYVKANGIDYAYDKSANTDWQKEVLRTGVSHNHNLSINGGGAKTKYMASINFMDRQGVVDGSHMNRLNIRSLLSSKVLKERLELSVGLNAMYGKNENMSMGKGGNGSGNEGKSVLDAMNYFNPTIPIKNADGTWSTGDGSANYNPLSIINEDPSETIWKRNQIVAKASLKIIEGLVWNANYSFDHFQSTFSSYHSHSTQLVPYNAYNGTANRSTYFGNNHTFETYVNYDHTFAKVHKLALMAGYSWEERNTGDGFGLTVHNFFDDYLKWNQLTYAGAIDGMPAVQSGTKEKIRNISFYGRVSYSYNSRYMLQATIRRDGSSVFADGHRWGTFPSVSAAWNVTEEPFMANQKVFDNLKLRLGYGVSGNALGFGAYSGVATYGATGTTFVYNGNSWAILGATKLANPDLKWESTGMFNVGLDYGFLNNRINGNIDFYTSTTTDLLLQRNLPKVSGYSNVYMNMGKTANKGLEITINSKNIVTKDFTWGTNLVWSWNKNEIKDLYGDEKSDIGNRWFIGEPISVIYDYEMVGIWQKDEIERGDHLNWDPQAQPGDVKLRDVNGDGKIDPNDDKTIQGQTTPKWIGGLTNTFTYKNLSLSIFIQTVQGLKRNNSLLGTASDEMGRRNSPTEIGYWSESNPSNEFRSLSKTSNRWGYGFPCDASFTRIKDVTLSYQFPAQIINALRISALTVYASARNLATFTSWKGWDPEADITQRGWGGYENNYPMTKSYVCGLNVTF